MSNKNFIAERTYAERTYNVSKIAAFRKTAELFGGLSNMAPGYPIRVNGVAILTTEALYQACRFPHMPEVQELILKERSPMTAKMVGKPFRSQSRPDFEQVKVDIMRWCLRIKLAQNFMSFGKLLESTGSLPIVEDSHKDAFWGAMRDKQDHDTLRGVNALGRLLMELRQHYLDNRYSCKTFQIDALSIPNFKLLGSDISIIDERTNFVKYVSEQLNVRDGIASDENIRHISLNTIALPLLQKEEIKPSLSPPTKKTKAKTLESPKKASSLLENKVRKKSTPKKVDKPLPLFSS